MTTPQQESHLLRAGFKVADTTTPKRVILSIEGLERTGKTHLAMTSEGDISYIYTDFGHEAVLHKFEKKGRRIYKVDIESGATLVQMGDIEAASKAWNKLRTAYYTALDNSSTVIVDTATEMWELLRMARFGKLTQVMPHQYGPVNAEYRELIRRAYDNPKVSLILLHKMKQEYVGNNRTGRMERSGFSETGFMVQMQIRCSREEGEFMAEVLDCRHNPSLQGLVLTGPMSNIPTILDLVHG